MRFVAALVTALAVTLAGASALRAEPCVVIEGARLGFTEQRVDVVVRGERVAQLGPSGAGEVDAACRRVAGAGRVLTPGFIAPHTELGLVEISLEPPTVDTDLKAPFGEPSGQVRAAVRAELAFNPRSSLLAVARLGGLTAAIAAPAGGVVSGRSFAVALGGPEGPHIAAAPVAMHASLGARAESRAVAFDTLDAVLGEALEFAAKESAWARHQTPPFGTPVRDLRALLPVARGALPLVVAVDRAADIEALLRLTARTPLRLIILGGAEAWQVAGPLAARRVPVIVDPLLAGPGGFDQLAARPDNAALLAAAGVPVMFGTSSSHHVRKLRQLAGNAVRAGLAPGVALDALTRVPAEAFGLADRGRLEVGARADLALWSGDPFELDTRLVGLWIGGAEQALTSRQTALRDRYRHLPPR